MDKTLDKIIIDDTLKLFHSNNEDEGRNSIYYSAPSSPHNVSPVFYIDYSPREDSAHGISTTLDSSIEEQQHNTPISNENHKYRIHLGTLPGYYKKGDITFAESQQLHSKIIDDLENFLSSFNVNYEFIKKDAISNTNTWGLEPYACILLTCSKKMANGVAAIVGLALRQAAIGIYTNSDDGFSHPVVTVSMPDGLNTEADILKLMKEVTEGCPCLSAQFDENGENIEFHDFGSENDKSISIEYIQTIISSYCGATDLFQVTKSTSNSYLLEKEDYQVAINRAGLQSYSALIELTRSHDYSYDKLKSTRNKITL
jgi:hypothetical protein